MLETGFGVVVAFLAVNFLFVHLSFAFLHFFLWCVCNSFVRISSLLWHCQWHTVIINLDIVSFFLIKRILFDLFHWHRHYGIAHYYKESEREEKKSIVSKIFIVLESSRLLLTNRCRKCRPLHNPKQILN